MVSVKRVEPPPRVALRGQAQVVGGGHKTERGCIRAENNADARRKSSLFENVGRRALVVMPPVDLPALGVVGLMTDFPLAALKLVSAIRKRGCPVEFLDFANIYSRHPSEEGVFTPDRIQRMAQAGDFRHEGAWRPIYRVGNTKDEIRARLKALPDDVDSVWISSIFTYCWPTTWETIELCHERFPHARIVLGGIYPTLCPDHAAPSGATEIVTGQVDEIASQWIDLESWGTLGHPFICMKTSIGCNNRCSYCAVRPLEGIARHFDTGDVCLQIDAYVAEGIRELQFWDSDILVQPGHFESILEHITNRDYGVLLSMPGGFSLARFSSDLASRMREAGFQNMVVPLETTRPDKIQEFHRRHLASRVEAAIAYAREAGFGSDRIVGVIMMGYPGQTKEDVLDDLLALMRQGILISLRVYTPIPGTADFEKYRHLFADRSLEDLDSFLFPLASPELPLSFLEDVYTLTNHRLFTREHLNRLRNDHPLFGMLADRW